MAVTESTKPSGVYKIVFSLVSTSDGTDTETTTSNYNGQAIWAVFDPDAGGTQPTADFDVVINDDDGYDILGGLGANLSNAANTYKAQKDGLGCFKNSKLACVGTNMGELKGATVTLYIDPMDYR